VADVILVTETGKSVGSVSYYCADQLANLVIVDLNKLEDGLVFKPSELSDRVSLTFLRSNKKNTISTEISRALRYCTKPWVLIIDDATFGTARNLMTVEAVAKTVPRLASIRQSKTPGINPVKYHQLMGTLYSTTVLNGIRSFGQAVADLSMVAYDWATAVGERGWLHVNTYVEDTQDSLCIVSPGEVEIGFLEVDEKDRLVIPQLESQGWMGSVKKRPWHYKATVVIPHYGKDLRLLINIVESWRLQTEHPYILIYDTGTPFEHHGSLKALESYDTEVHFCRWHGVRNPYDSVALVYNHGITDCRTRHIIFTHNDVVPISQTVVSDLLSSSFEETPVVGYESLVCPYLVGTHLTAGYMPVLNRVRARWEGSSSDTWIEEGFNRCLSQAGITPRLIGKEKRWRYKTTHFDHVGSLTSAEVFTLNKNERQFKVDLDQVLEETESRLSAWRGL
jgi:hypothetical protein